MTNTFCVSQSFDRDTHNDELYGVYNGPVCVTLVPLLAVSRSHSFLSRASHFPDTTRTRTEQVTNLIFTISPSVLVSHTQQIPANIVSVLNSIPHSVLRLCTHDENVEI